MPPVTAAIAAVTAAVSLLVDLSGQLVPAAYGAGFVAAAASGYDPFPPDVFVLPAWLTPLSSTLIHAGAFHLISNLLILFVAGAGVERAIGARGAGVLYLLGAYAAAAGQWASDPSSLQPVIGASGAISALLGAYALLYGRRAPPRVGPIPAWLVQAAWLLAAWTVVNLGFALVAQDLGYPIALWAHIGGFAAGLVLARPLLVWRRRAARPLRVVN